MVAKTHLSVMLYVHSCFVFRLYNLQASPNWDLKYLNDLCTDLWVVRISKVFYYMWKTCRTDDTYPRTKIDYLQFLGQILICFNFSHTELITFED